MFGLVPCFCFSLFVKIAQFQLFVSRYNVRVRVQDFSVFVLFLFVFFSFMFQPKNDFKLYYIIKVSVINLNYTTVWYYCDFHCSERFSQVIYLAVNKIFLIEHRYDDRIDSSQNYYTQNGPKVVEWCSIGCIIQCPPNSVIQSLDVYSSHWKMTFIRRSES